MKCFEGKASLFFVAGVWGTHPCSNNRLRETMKGFVMLHGEPPKGSRWEGKEGLSDSPPTGANLVRNEEMCLLLEECSRMKYLK